MLEVEQLSFSYPKGRDIFSGLDLVLASGELLCLLGPNGCGKSTLLFCLLRLLKPTAGKVLVGGRDASRLTPRELARMVSFVPQGHKKTFPFKVRDIVLMGLAAHCSPFNGPGVEEEQRVVEALEMVGMMKYYHTPYTMLSGGETQLVLLARAFAQRTPLIVLDEPTAHLDFRHEIIVLENLAVAAKAAGSAVLMATHSPNNAFYLKRSGARVSAAIMGGGRVITRGLVSEVINPAQLARGFGVRACVARCKNPDGGDTLEQILPLGIIQEEDGR